MSGRRQTLTYHDSGVDIAAGNRLVTTIAALAGSTDRAGVASAIGGFGGLFDPKAAGYDDPVLVAATDGVGTKLKVATEAGRCDTIGIDLVAMCVNDLVVQGAEPLFFLDYFATGQLSEDVAAAVVAGIAQGCRMAGAALIGGETAEMPGLYRDGDFDLAGFAVGAVARGAILPRSDIIMPGDRILALASSGVHSNGFSLIRRVVEKSGLRLDGPAPFGPGRQLADELLEPTRIYVAACLRAIRETGAIKATAHITGGGLVENLPRALPDGLAARIDLGAIDVPPVFGWLARHGPVADAEMLRTFNCGVGMVVIVGAAEADAVSAVLEAAGETVRDLGEVVRRDTGPIAFEGSLDLGQG